MAECICRGFEECGFQSALVEISNPSLPRSDFSPKISIDRIKPEEVKSIVSDGAPFITFDDVRILKLLHKLGSQQLNGLAWIHYFIGHRAVFKQYRDWQHHSHFQENLKTKVLELLPPALTNISVRYYTEGLRHLNLVAGSIWTCLLINRVYNLNCPNVVYAPIDPEEFRADIHATRSNQATIFFGSLIDTNLEYLHSAITILRRHFHDIELNAFGNKHTSKTFTDAYGENVSFHTDMERSALLDLINRSTVTIAPIYNGNFELVPIESLLVGTPVITFPQPFLEVTHNSDMISSIYSENEMSKKAAKWASANLDDERSDVRQRILNVMNFQRVVKELRDAFTSLGL